MEILLWLVPAALVTVVAMLWVGWLGRAHRGEVDRDEAVARMGRVLEREHPARRAVPSGREADHSTGVAVRRSRRAA